MKRIKVVKEFTFDAAHHLPNYDGPCRNLHGHTYKLQVGVDTHHSGNEDSGMVVDFTIMKRIIKRILEHIDHADLNEVNFMGFPKALPTAENMVLWLTEILPILFYEELKKHTVHVCLIRLWETPTSYAEWTH